MKGYVQRKGNRYYAVIYEGLDPVTGKEKRSWHPAGTDRAEAEQLARRLAAERNGRNDHLRSLTFGAFLTSQWLPVKRRVLLADTLDGDGDDKVCGDEIGTRWLAGGVHRVRAYSAVISVTAARAEDSSTMAFLAA